MITIIIVFGIPTLVTIGAIACAKKISQRIKLNKAIENLNGQNPYDVLFEKDNFYDTIDKQHFHEVVEKEAWERHQLGFFGKIKSLFSLEKSESSRTLKEMYKEKKAGIKRKVFDGTDAKSSEILKQECLSRAKTAYKILKSPVGREKSEVLQQIVTKVVKEIPKKVVKPVARQNKGRNKLQNRGSKITKVRDAHEALFIFRGIRKALRDAFNTPYQPTERFQNAHNQTAIKVGN